MPDFNDDAQQPQVATQFAQQTMVQTINNPDGTVSIIQIDTGDGNNPQIVAMADGTVISGAHMVSVANHRLLH